MLSRRTQLRLQAEKKRGRWPFFYAGRLRAKIPVRAEVRPLVLERPRAKVRLAQCAARQCRIHSLW